MYDAAAATERFLHRSEWAIHRWVVEGMMGCDRVAEWANAPNVLLYGAEGFPHDFLWRHALARAFGVPFATLCHLRPCKWNDLLPFEECSHCFRIQVGHPDMPKDMGSLIDFVKQLVGTHCVVAPRHVIVLEDVDRLRAHPQVFRVLLERFSQTAWFVCTTHHLSKLEPPLVSRFHAFRVPLLPAAEVAALTGRTGTRAWTPTSSEAALVRAFVAKLRTALDDKPKALSALRALAYELVHACASLVALAAAVTPHVRRPERRAQWLSAASDIQSAMVRTSPMRWPLYYEAFVLRAALSWMPTKKK